MISLSVRTAPSLVRQQRRQFRKRSGDKSSKAVFSDPKDLSGILNDLNRGEIARLDAIIEQANKAKAQCLSAIAANEDHCRLRASEGRF